MIDERTLHQWMDQAQLTLEQAQRLCTRAQTALHATTYQLQVSFPDKVERAHLLSESLRRQHDLMAAVVASVKTKVATNVVRPQNDQYEQSLVPALNELDHVVAQLHATVVPHWLIEDNTIDSKTLGDFISTNSIELLKRNIGIYKANSDKIQRLLNIKLQDLVVEPFSINTKKYYKIMKQADELVPLSYLKSDTMINTILKEKVSLENELVSILEMLTNHYDQTKQGIQYFRTGQAANLEVLESDVQELPEVLRELSAVCDIVGNNATRATKYVSSKMELTETVVSSIQEQLELYRDLKTKKIPQFVFLYLSSKEILKRATVLEPNEYMPSPLKEYTDTVNQLVYHYKQFLEVYRTKYLLELHSEQYSYPRKYLAKLLEFLDRDLTELQTQETERRREWLAKYGEFIPKEFKLPGELKQPTIVQIVTEGLEELETKQEEKALIDLIRRMRNETK